MQSLFDTAGQEIVALCNDAPRLKPEVERLTAELQTERNYRKFIEKEMRKKSEREYAYKHIDDVYRSLKSAAEHEAQEPIDEHYRRVRDVLSQLREAIEGLSISILPWPFCDALHAADRELGKAGAA